MSLDLSSFKVAASELSSATKFNNLVQAIQDFVNALPIQNIASFPSDSSKFLRGDGTWAAPSGAAAPTGALMMWSTGTAPTGWQLCDGTAISRAGNAALDALLSAAGYPYGNGDGSTTFNVPDLRGRVPVGKGTHADVTTLGANDGVAVANRRPKHRHTPHSHVAPWTSFGNQTGGGANAGGIQAGGPSTSSTDGGSGNANDSLDAPAYLVVNYIIKL